MRLITKHLVEFSLECSNVLISALRLLVLHGAPVLVLCAFLTALLLNCTAETPLSELWRMYAYVDGVQCHVPVLNDALLVTDCPAATAKYVIQNEGRAQKQFSSGVWISTAAGSTGAIHSAGSSCCCVLY